jgi:hypothetical protein
MLKTFGFILYSVLVSIFSGLFFRPATAQAATAEAPYRLGPVSSALGGAGRAAVDEAESFWLNPAALVHVRSYHVAFSHQQSHRDLGDSYRDWAVALADSGEDKMAAGSFSYIQRNHLRGGAGAIASESRDFQLSLASFFPNRKVAMGLTYHRLVHEQPGFDSTQDNYSVGFLYSFADKLGLALVGQDLAGASDSVAPEARMIPTVSFGLHVIPHPIVRLRADVVRRLELNPNNLDHVHLGLESWFDANFAFRMGSAWLESQNEQWLTVGLGFKGPRLSFGYAFEIQTREKVSRDTNGTRHSFDLWLPL